MASPIIERLRFLLDGDSTRLVKALKEGEKQATSTTKGIIRSFLETEISTANLGNVLGNVLTSAAKRVATSLFNSTRAAVEQAEAFEKDAQRTGVLAEDLSTLDFAIEISGGKIEDLTGGLEKLARRLEIGGSSGARVTNVLEKLGVTTEDLVTGKTRPLVEILKDVATEFASTEDGAAKTAASIELFGRSAGPKLIPFLNAGRDGIEALQAEARLLGLEISTDNLEAHYLAVGQSMTFGSTEVFTASRMSRPARSMAVARSQGRSILALSAAIMARTTLVTRPPAR